MTRTAWYIATGAALALIVSLLALTSASDSEAIVTYAVNSTLDEPDAANDGLCMSTPSGVCSVRAAVMQTNQLPGKDIMDVPAGFYQLTIAGSGEDFAATGDLDILDDVKIDGASGIATIDGGDLDRVFDIDPITNNLDVEIYDIRVQDGLAPGATTGGGIDTHDQDTLVHIERSFFDSNGTALNGGGLHSRSQLTLIDVEFRENAADDGGGLYLDGPSATMNNVRFFDNGAADSGGGLVSNGGIAALTDGIFSGNIAGVRGGAIKTHTPFSLDGAMLDHNFADLGGAVYSSTGSATTINQATFDNNEADYGGAVYNVDEVAINHSLLTSNFANIDGGGILNSGFGITELRNVTISGNEAVANGGGIANYGDLVFMNNVTVTLNTADFNIAGAGEGGGVFNDLPIGSDVLISNTIIGNNNFPVSSPDCDGFLSSNGYNLIGDTTGCNFGSDATDLLNVYPDLVTLQDNGGPTLTHKLTGNSPALDAANPATPGSGFDSCEIDDQRGVTRPRDGTGDGNARCDIGAYETLGQGPTATPFGTPTPPGTATPSVSPTPVPGTPTPTSSPTPVVTASPTDAPLSLTWANGNCIGGIDPVDSLAILRADAGLQATQGPDCITLGDIALFDGDAWIWGDFDCSGSMSPVDALKVLQYDSGFQPIQPADCPDFGDSVLAVV